MSFDKLLDKIDRWCEDSGIYAMIDVGRVDVGDCTVGGDEHEPKLFRAGILRDRS